MTDEQNCSGLDEERSSWSDVRDEMEFEDAEEWMKVRGKSPHLQWRHRQLQHQQDHQNEPRVAATESKCQAMSILEYAHDESEEAEAPIYVVDDTN